MGNTQPSQTIQTSPVTAAEENDIIDNANSTDIIRLAYLIGINYTGTNSELSGCINDTYNIRKFLTDNKYVDHSNIQMLNDDATNHLYPSKSNILKIFSDLVNLARLNPNKKYLIFISYSGHGTYIPDTNGDESDKHDEALCPIDFETNGLIVDDDIRLEFINKLPSNVRLVMLIDACHSGTILDIKYNYAVDGTTRCKKLAISDSAAKVVMISGSRDDQTSADAYIQNKYTLAKEYQGAMTASFLANYVENITYESLIQTMRTWLRSQSFSQVPQLSSGQPINIKRAYMLSKFNNYQ